MALALGSLLLGLWSWTGSAQASFPGANGKIAFSSNPDGKGEIYVMNADGSGQTNLSQNVATDADPAWSPDGQKLAFTSGRDGNFETYVMNADGSGQTNLTQNAAGDFQPAWSPDGQKLAFHSRRDGDGDVYVMNADGSGLANLTQNAAGDAGPAWQPILAADLGVSVNAPVTVKSKWTMTYTVTVMNHGPSRAKNLQLVDELPYGTVFDSAAVPARWTCTTPRKGKAGRVTCTVPEMALGQAATSLIVKVTAGPNNGALNNVARLSSDTLDPNSSNNTDTTTTTVYR